MGDFQVRCIKVFGHPETKKLIDEAYKGLKEEHLSPTWFTEDKCFTVKQKEKNTVYIFDVFEGDAFDHIASLGCRILGPLCILTSLACKTDIPRRYKPVYNLAMKGVVVCCTNIDREERDPLHKKVELMGGDVSKDFTEEVTHLVAAAVGSKKYVVAASTGKQIMLPQWVSAVWEKSKLEAVHGLDEQFQEYKCPVFLGRVVTVSGLSSAERKETQRLIEKEGGKYSGEMKVKECTHLIINEPKGQKYLFARKWQIAIVRSEWLYDSIEKGFCQDEANYSVESTSEANKGEMKTSTPERKSMAGGIADISNISMISMVNVNETAASTNMTSDITRLDEPDLIESLDVSKCPADLFLDGCKIYLSGFRGTTLEKLRKIINNGGGTRSNQITDNLTHVVVGEKVADDLEKVKALGSRPHMVTSQWLADCYRQGTLLGEAGYCSVELPPVAPTTPKAKGPTSKKKGRVSNEGEKSSLPEPAGYGGGDDMEELMSQYLSGPDPGPNDTTVVPPPPNVEEEDLTQDPAETTEASQTVEGGVFCGKTFVFYGFEEDQVPVLASFIKESGGKTLKNNARQIPDFAVVPIDGFPVDRTVKDIVTNAWLQVCIEQEQLLAVGANPLFTPLEIKIEAAPLRDCVLSISGYQGTERDCLMHIAEALGARIQECFVRTAKNNLVPSTHLLVNAPEGSKYQAAKKWGIPAVSNSWLLDCAKSGNLLPVDKYSIDKSEVGQAPSNVVSKPAAKLTEVPAEAQPESERHENHVQNLMCSKPEAGENKADLPTSRQNLNNSMAKTDVIDKQGVENNRQSLDTSKLKSIAQDGGKTSRQSFNTSKTERLSITKGNGENLPDFSATGDTEALLLGVKSQEDEVTFKGDEDNVEDHNNGDDVDDNHNDGGDDDNDDEEITFKPATKKVCDIDNDSLKSAKSSESKNVKNVHEDIETPVRDKDEWKKDTTKEVAIKKVTRAAEIANMESQTRTETPPLSRYIKRLDKGDPNTGTPLLTSTSIRDKLMAREPVQYDWRNPSRNQAGNQTGETSHSQKENVGAIGTPVQSRVKELRKNEGRTDDKDTPSKFLNPNVRYLPKFDTEELMKAFETPEDVRAARAKRRNSLPLDELFEMKMEEAQQTVQRARERKLQERLLHGSQHDEPDGDMESEPSDVLQGVVIAVAKKLGKDQSELNEIVASLGGDYRWNFDNSCTHFIFQGRQNDTAKDFKLARSHGLHIVSPHWLHMCKEQNARVDESLFPHTFNPNLSLSVVATRRTPMRTPARSTRRNMRDRLNSKPESTSGSREEKLPAGVTVEKLLSPKSETEDKGNSKTTPDRKSSPNEIEAEGVEGEETGGSLEMKEALSRQLENVMAESKGKKRRRSKRLNCSGQAGTPDDVSNSSSRQSRRTQENVQKSNSSKSVSEEKEEKNSGDIGPSQSVHVVWDDPMGRMEQEKLAHMLQRAESPTQDVGDMYAQEEAVDAQYSDVEDDAIPVEVPFTEQKLDRTTPKLSRQSSDKTPTPEGPSIAFPTSSSASRVTPPKPLPLDEEAQPLHRSTPIFMVSAMTQPEKVEYGALIEQLGGKLLDCQDFDITCTHLVIGSVNRNEKFLASIASGKWVLHKSYFDACREEQKFVNEDFYEWGSAGTLSLVKNMDSNVRMLAAAARDWRIKVHEDKKTGERRCGAFCSWRVLLCCDKNKEGSYRRLLEAGGATVLNIKPPFSGKIDITHALLELHKVSLSQEDLEALVTSGCLCLKPGYICAFLSNPSSDVTDFCVPEIIALKAAMSAETSGKKRKASTGDISLKRSKRR